MREREIKRVRVFAICIDEKLVRMSVQVTILAKCVCVRCKNDVQKHLHIELKRTTKGSNLLLTFEILLNVKLNSVFQRLYRIVQESIL